MILKDDLDPKYSQLFAPAFRRTTALHLTPVAADNAEAIVAAAAHNPTGSRVGGAAVITKEYPWPLDINQKPMMHLAQLNLAQLPQRDGYPTSGLLQFFIANDDEMGLDFAHSEPKSQGFVIRLIPAEQLAGATVEYHPPVDNYLIQGGFFTVTGQLYDQAPSIDDRDFERLGLNFTEEELDELYDILHPGKHTTIFGGGWAHFTQFDPRDAADDREILLQLDTYFGDKSPVELMWGDCGIGNFFISKEDLSRLDFSRVLYNWDCC